MSSRVTVPMIGVEALWDTIHRCASNRYWISRDRNCGDGCLHADDAEFVRTKVRLLATSTRKNQTTFQRYIGWTDINGHGVEQQFLVVSSGIMTI